MPSEANQSKGKPRYIVFTTTEEASDILYSLLCRMVYPCSILFKDLGDGYEQLSCWLTDEELKVVDEAFPNAQELLDWDEEFKHLIEEQDGEGE